MAGKEFFKEIYFLLFPFSTFGLAEIPPDEPDSFPNARLY